MISGIKNKLAHGSPVSLSIQDPNTIWTFNEEVWKRSPIRLRSIYGHIHSVSLSTKAFGMRQLSPAFMNISAYLPLRPEAYRAPHTGYEMGAPHTCSGLHHLMDDVSCRFERPHHYFEEDVFHSFNFIISASGPALGPVEYHAHGGFFITVFHEQGIGRLGHIVPEFFELWLIGLALRSPNDRR